MSTDARGNTNDGNANRSANSNSSTHIHRSPSPSPSPSPHMNLHNMTADEDNEDDDFDKSDDDDNDTTVGEDMEGEGRKDSVPRAMVEPLTRGEKDHILLGQSLILNGEYLRCAHMLRRQEQDTGSSSSLQYGHTNAMKVTSAHGVFLANYSLYMAGEKLKDQEQVEREGKENRDLALANAANANNVPPGAANKTKKPEAQKLQSKNPFLSDIFKDLYPIYAASATSLPTKNTNTGQNSTQSNHHSCKMDAFLLYMLAIIVRDLHAQQGGVLSMQHSIGVYGKSQGKQETAAIAIVMPTAYELLLSSLKAYPWNWSCWLDLQQLCMSSQTSPPTWDDIYAGGDTNREACQWIMYQHFLASFYLEQQNGDAALTSISTLAEWFPASHTIVTYKALAHYALRDYDRAQECFEAARTADPHQLAHVDTYSNILYVKERRAELSHLAHAVTKIDKFSAEACCVVGNYYSLKGKHERAITYFQRALRANPKFLPAWTLMGHECVELRNTAAAGKFKIC